MIEEIRISSLGVIEESVLELGPGLTVITGETGAGKTMLVTALGLLMGGRADTGAVRTGAKSARVEGLVRADAELTAIADEHGGEVELGQLLLGRQVSAEGRSRAFLGGASVPASALAPGGRGPRGRPRPVRPAPAAAARGPARRPRRLRRGRRSPRCWRATGPGSTGCGAVERGAARGARVGARACARGRRAPARAGGDRGGRARRRARRTCWPRRRPGSGYADTLRTAAETAREALSSDQDAADALGAVAGARRALESVRDHDPEAASLADRVAEVSYLLADVAADVASYSTGVETDPQRLAAVSERRAALTALTRKYGETSAEVIEWSRLAAERLMSLEDSDESIEALRAERAQLRAGLAGEAAELTRLRREAGEVLSARVTDELHSLSMPHARFGVRLDRAEEAGGLEIDGRSWRFGPTGVDEVELVLAANTGSEPRPLTKGASGGELSRVMLAIEVALADTRPVPTFVFDEVDAGVGGKAAVEIGRRLAALARSAQVLVVTHLPQVAAFADRHVVVRKSSDGTVTTSGLDRPRRRGPGPGALPDARRARGVRHRDGARPGAARRGSVGAGAAAARRTRG